MNIYKLIRLTYVDYGEAVAFIIQAKTEKDARFIASLHCGAEGVQAWTGPNSTLKVCKIGTTKAKTPKVLLRNFQNE